MTKSFLDYTDDELSAMSLSDLPEEQEEESSEEAAEVETNDESDEVDANASTETEEEEVETEEASEEEEQEQSEEENESDIKESDIPESKDSGTDKETSSTEETKTEQVEDTKPVDYKSEYERLLAPFKANGKEVKVDSVDEAVQLMQMGANYTKKMSALKPHLRLVKMLENNGLLDETKLSHLIDVSKKNPAAIAKAVKDAGIDPLDIDGSADYVPSNYNVSDQSLQLDEVLADLRGTPSFATTLQVVTEKWDKQSQNVIAENPELLRVINSHVDNGVYEKVMAQVNKARMLGQLTNVPDIVAYKMVGDELAKTQESQGVKPAGTVIAKQAEPIKQNVDLNVNKRKQAVAPSKGKSKTVEEEFNPLNLSDDEFLRLAEKNKFF